MAPGDGENGVLAIGVSAEPATDALVVPVLQDESPAVEGLPEPLAAAVRRAAGRPGWSGRRRHRSSAEPDGGGVGRVLLHGLGPRSELDLPRLLEWCERLGRELGRQAVSSATVLLPADVLSAAGPGRGAALNAVLRMLFLTAYRFEAFRSESAPERLERLEIVAPGEPEPSLAAALARARVLAEAIAYTRDLANTPPNIATPAWMVERAAELARDRDLACEVLGRPELEARGMGGILAVAAGSRHDPRLVRLEWGQGEPVTALVGKGVTFDTGGISIKPARAMDEMKYDKCGACTVLGIARAARDLGLRGTFRAYLPLVENMPGGEAYRPGDIVRCYGGTTVEVLNTDAEGRMILADALAWAAEEGPRDLVEMSTLTGACVVALGPTGAGLFTPEDSMAEELLAAAEACGERLWRLPLWREFYTAMEGRHADLRNVGPRWGGANAAAAFLSTFVGEVRRWAHLDIAGPAYVGQDGKGPRGATGYGVALTLDWLAARATSDP